MWGYTKHGDAHITVTPGNIESFWSSTKSVPIRQNMPYLKSHALFEVVCNANLLNMKLIKSTFGKF